MAACSAAVVLRHRVFLLLPVAAIGMLSGSLAATRHADTLDAVVPQGRGDLVGVVMTDATPYGQGYRFVLRPAVWTAAGSATAIPWPGPAVAVTSESAAATAGDWVSVSGLSRSDPDEIRGDPVAGRIHAVAVERLAGPAAPAAAAGNLVRNRVHSRLSAVAGTPEGALLSGFLIGDIARLPESDTDALRRAGLTHYVAVSGSNVALVLGGWWLVLGLVGAGTRTRAATGLIVLVVFVVATRWESSVIRAATMAALVMGGRACGIPIDAWGALGGAVALLLVVSGGLAYDVGFQLSVAATGGVLAGMRIWAGRRPRLVWGLLAATVSAQLAVVPLLLLHFGTVPLLSPVANLLAAPLVTGATAAAGLGVIVSWDLPVHLAATLAGLVLGVARTASGWPQLDFGQVVAMATVLALSWATPLRWAVLVAIGGLATSSLLPPVPPEVPTVVFLDVGQGDAVLLLDPSGAAALIDGGRDPTVLRTKLRDHGVGHIDLLVATHGDIDHVGGLTELPLDVGELWIPAQAERGEALGAVLDRVAHNGGEVREVRAGDGAELGEFRLEVLGPQRRYAADNDGSVVLLVTVGHESVLLPGDIGEHAQRDLGGVHVDVLMVPHHGAATTDLDWLRDSSADLAVISVGPNTYGHPAPEVVATLEQAGMRLLTTWEAGDISIPLR
ncbi:MAG: ComEC/Rec2 family competence protein [Acidimicrobiia bacterium]|nr:ComEC/Rec2 family competence protein [Acidimicrobiia bacterium]